MKINNKKIKKLFFLFLLGLNTISFAEPKDPFPPDNTPKCYASPSPNLYRLLGNGREGLSKENPNTILEKINKAYLSGSGRSYTDECEKDRAYRSIENKFNSIQNAINDNINRNFEKGKQIPYSFSHDYISNSEFIETPKLDFGNTDGTKKMDFTNTEGTKEKMKIDYFKEGLNKTGLVKFIYGKSGADIEGLDNISLAKLAQNTKYVYTGKEELRSGDVLVYNYKDDEDIDGSSVVYYDNKAHKLKMLEMGGNLISHGSSVKSEIPISSKNGTVYVVPYETMLNLIYGTQYDDPFEYREMVHSIDTQSPPLISPVKNENVTKESEARPGGEIFDNGYTDGQVSPLSFSQESSEELAKNMNDFQMQFHKGMVVNANNFALVLIITFLLLFLIDVLWSILVSGSNIQIDDAVTIIMQKMIKMIPYFGFLLFFPTFLNHIFLPITMLKIPKYLFGDLISALGINVSARGGAVSFTSVCYWLLAKCTNLILAFFGGTVINQLPAIKDMKEALVTLWQHIIHGFQGNFIEFAAAGRLLGKILLTLYQTIFFRPLTALMGSICILSIIHITLNFFLSTLTMIVSTTVSMFYLLTGSMEMLKGKGLITLNVIVSCMLQYFVQLAFILIIGLALENLGKNAIFTIINPFNIKGLIELYVMLCVTKQIITSVGKGIAKNF